jgi:hypothetical protein
LEAAQARQVPVLAPRRRYKQARKHQRGRPPKDIIRIPWNVAHAQVIKEYEKKHVKSVRINIAHGTQKCVSEKLGELGYLTINTSAAERFNATKRLMDAYQVRKSIAFSRHPRTRDGVGWWTTVVYNYCRPHESLKEVIGTDHRGHNRYKHRTPAMAAGVVPHILTIEAILRTPVYPPHNRS